MGHSKTNIFFFRFFLCCVVSLVLKFDFGLLFQTNINNQYHKNSGGCFVLAAFRCRFQTLLWHVVVFCWWYHYASLACTCSYRMFLFQTGSSQVNPLERHKSFAEKERSSLFKFKPSKKVRGYSEQFSLSIMYNLCTTIEI